MKKLNKKQVTTDFDLASQAKYCQQTKLREKIQNAAGRQGQIKSEKMCAHHQTTELRRQNARDGELFADLCKKMEARNREISSLIVQNRCLQDITDKKLQTIFYLESKFQTDRCYLQEQFQDIKKELKYLPKDNLPLWYPQEKANQTKSSKEKVMLNRPTWILIYYHVSETGLQITRYLKMLYSLKIYDFKILQIVIQGIHD